MTRPSALLGGFAIVAVAPCASASIDEGLELAKQAAAAYKEGRFEQAIELYQRAHAANPDPISIHNIGRCHESIGYRDLGDKRPGAAPPDVRRVVRADFAAAVDHYQRFLAAEPAASNRLVVEQRIRALQAQLDLIDGLAARPAEATSEPARGPLRVAAPWAVVGLGGVTLGAGVVVSVMASSSESTANDPATSGASSLDAAGDASTFATTANVLFAVGGALTIAGGVWAVVDLASSPVATTSAAAREASAPRLELGPGGVRLSRAF